MMAIRKADNLVNNARPIHKDQYWACLTGKLKTSIRNCPISREVKEVKVERGEGSSLSQSYIFFTHVLLGCLGETYYLIIQ